MNDEELGKRGREKPPNRMSQLAMGDMSVQLVSSSPPSPVSHHLLGQLFLVAAGQWDPAETMLKAWGKWVGGERWVRRAQQGCFLSFAKPLSAP